MNGLTSPYKGKKAFLGDFSILALKHLSPQNVIFPVKMIPIHKVLYWSLGGQGIILTRAQKPRYKGSKLATLTIK